MASDIANAKMTVETPDGVTYVFPNVKLEVAPNIEPGEMYGDPKYFYQQGPSHLRSMSISGHAFPGGESKCIMTLTKGVEVVPNCKIPEIYAEDLTKIKDVMESLHYVAQTGVFACEIRVRTDDVDTWVVIGYGMDGEPAILRFERDE